MIYLADVRVYVPEIATRAALIYLAGVRVYVPEIATRAALIGSYRGEAATVQCPGV